MEKGEAFCVSLGDVPESDQTCFARSDCAVHGRPGQVEMCNWQTLVSREIVDSIAAAVAKGANGVKHWDNCSMPME